MGLNAPIFLLLYMGKGMDWWKKTKNIKIPKF